MSFFSICVFFTLSAQQVCNLQLGREIAYSILPMEIIKFIKSCPICQSIFPCPKWICPACLKYLKSSFLSIDNISRFEKNMVHMHLFDWNEINQRFISRLLNCLKGGQMSEAFQALALEMFSRFAYSNHWPADKEILFIPAPSKQGQFKDHAFMLAKSLQFYFGGKVVPCLKRTQTRMQKFQNKTTRSQIKFELTEDFKPETCIFVDDVLTTGSTARAAYRALKKPKNFLICTLAWRRFVEPQLISDFYYKKFQNLLKSDIQRQIH